MELNNEINCIIDGNYVEGKIVQILENKYLVLLNDGSKIYVNKEDVI